MKTSYCPINQGLITTQARFKLKGAGLQQFHRSIFHHINRTILLLPSHKIHLCHQQEQHHYMTNSDLG